MKKYYIAIDIGATNTKFGLLKMPGRIVSKKIIKTTDYKNPQEFSLISRNIIYSFLKDRKITKNSVVGIGIGAPGPIDNQKGLVHYFVNIPGWKEVPIRRMLMKKVKLPVFIDNDVNVMTLGEYKFGAGKGSKDIVGITLGSGVGGGLILNGKLFYGANMAAGEIGHMPINVNGPACPCGGHACLEAYVGNKRIASRAKSEMQGKKTLIKSIMREKNSRLSPKIIYEAAKRNDKIAKKILHDTGVYIGVGLTGIVNLLNPEKIVIGGGVSNAGRFIFKAIEKTVKNRAMKIHAKTVKIVKAKLGEDAGLMGCLALVEEGLKQK